MTRKNTLIGLQIILGIAFLLQPIILPVKPDDMDRVFFSKEILKNIAANALIIAFFYFNYFFLIPKFYFSKKYVSYFLSVFVCFLGVLLVASTLTSRLPSSRTGRPHRPPAAYKAHQPPVSLPHTGISEPPHSELGRKPPPHHRSAISRFRFFFTENDQTFFLFGAIVLFSLLLRVSNRYYKTENAKQEAEINYLLAQINPHFLFNALNSIYTLTIKEKAHNSSTSLLKLSGLLRYVFTETNNNIVPLEKEMACISDFIDLQKLRLNENVQLNYTFSGNFYGKQIAPMLLMPFVENAFKHGVSTDERSEINIKIDVANDSLKVEVSNSKVAVNNEGIGKSGLGIANARNRLQLLYPDKHHLRIADDEHLFTVILKIFF